MSMLVANARMYAVTPALRDAWRALFALISRRSGVDLTYVDHAAPAPLDDLWARDDLGAAFMCGFPFASAAIRPTLVAAPVPSPGRYGGQPRYCTDLVVRADSDCAQLRDVFGGRVGWTTDHSQSGCRALHRHLTSYGVPRRLFAEWVGPLVTPRRVVDAVLAGEIDIGPLDSYVHDLLRRHEPATAARLRTVASTPMTPIPPLIASLSTPAAVVEQLRHALLGAVADPEAAPILETLLLAGFARVDAADYDVLMIAPAPPPAAG
jgi:ABC-type phosphate/phosphonate transport system substrate-binding protein